MKYLFDTSVWIEYFEGSEVGAKINSYLTEENEIFITSLNIAETLSKIQRKKGNLTLVYKAMISFSKIAEVTPFIAKEAALLYLEERKKNGSFGLVDALIFTAARKNGATLITTDRHFKHFKETIVL